MSEAHVEGATPDVLVFGARTCEDTAITRSRLEALGVPYREIDIDADPAGLARVLELEGRRVTPTVVLGDGPVVMTEPSIERLEEALRADGHEFAPPAAAQLGGPLADRPIPLRTLPDAKGAPFSLESIRGRMQSAVFFGHDGACLACFGYARQLANQAAAMREADAVPIVVVHDTSSTARGWTEGLAEGVTLLADEEGAWSRAVKVSFPAEPGGVLLLVLDRYGAPRAASAAAEAGGLIGPAEATDWLRFLILECPECGNDVRWPE